MDNLQMDEKLAQLRRCRREIDTLKKEAEAVEAEVKAELETRGVDQLETAHYKVSWKPVSTIRLDTKALKAERPEIYDRYAVTSATKRFTIT
jgi:predicted phage-related endonuclease